MASRYYALLSLFMLSGCGSGSETENAPDTQTETAPVIEIDTTPEVTPEGEPESHPILTPSATPVPDINPGSPSEPDGEISPTPMPDGSDMNTSVEQDSQVPDEGDSVQGTSDIHTLSYPIVDTYQRVCTSLQDTLEVCPSSGEPTYGQDAQYAGFAPDYTSNGDGTVTDNVTGLMWVNTTDTDGDGVITAADKLTYDEGIAYAMGLTYAGYSDWRVPTIKELYSLILFDGLDPSGFSEGGRYAITPFIHMNYFAFNAGDVNAGERLIDSQYLSSTKYVSTTMNGSETVFGVNFMDGRIKGYGIESRQGGGEKAFYVLLVRGNPAYGVNKFADNGDGTITDEASGLLWQQGDNGESVNFEAALSYCEGLELAGKTTWRLPNVKELQSLVDYTRAPDTTNGPAIDIAFTATQISNESGAVDWGMYWSSTTHLNMVNARSAAYVAFGRAMGYMQEQWMDVHGAGAQRSDPKVGNPADYPTGHGPQGDAVRINNMVRCVTDDITRFNANPSQPNREAFDVVM